MMKYIFAFLIVLNGLFPSGGVIASDVKEFQMHTIMSAMNLGESAIVVNEDEVIVDYVMKGKVRNKDDVATQLQMIFIAAAKIAPETTITVIKGRYVADYDPVIYVVVPTKATLFFMEGIIDPDEFWSFVSFNEADIIKEVNRLEPFLIPDFLWYLLGFFVGGGLLYRWRKWRKENPPPQKKKEDITKSEPKKETVEAEISEAKPEISVIKKEGIFEWTHGEYGWFRKLLTLLFNIPIPGLGYFILGKRYIKKAFLFILITFLLVIFVRQLVLFFYIYVFVDMIMLFKSKK